MTRSRTDCASPSPCWRAALVVAFCGLLVAASPVTAAEPTRYAPAKGLTAYIEYDGVRAHADAWKATAAYAMLQGTPAGKMTDEVARQVIDRILKMGPGVKITGADLIALNEHLMAHGFSFALYGAEGGDGSAVIVLSGVGRKPTRERLTHLVRELSSEEDGAEAAEIVRFRGRDLYRTKTKQKAEADPEADPAVPPPPEMADADVKVVKVQPDGATWWFEGDDLILVQGPMPDKDKDAVKGDAATLPARAADVIDTIEGKQPSVVTHPGYIAARAEGRDIKGFESNGLFFIESGGFLSVATVKPSSILPGLNVGLRSSNAPIAGLTLPSGKYMHDDVQYFPSGPEAPYANTQAATQRARRQAVAVAPGLPRLAGRPAP